VSDRLVAAQRSVLVGWPRGCVHAVCVKSSYEVQAEP
jgi:hypothetical protein